MSSRAAGFLLVAALVLVGIRTGSAMAASEHAAPWLLFPIAPETFEGELVPDGGGIRIGRLCRRFGVPIDGGADFGVYPQARGLDTTKRFSLWAAYCFD